MPPRSVCLNVFTTSLGNDVGLGKEREVDVEVTEVEDKMEGVESVVERERHDSVQGPPNDTATTTSCHDELYATKIDVASLPLELGPQLTKDGNMQTTTKAPTTCSTCGEAPIVGVSLSRCSRCKNAFYCSKNCQKSAWKLHKYDCVPTGALHGLFPPSSAMHTPDISTPASPVADEMMVEPYSAEVPSSRTV
jgi:hypothetical protein